MAALTDANLEHVEPIDPRDEPVFAVLPFTLPEATDIDWANVNLSYDRLSDILLVFVADRSQPAVVVYGDDPVWSLLVNPDTMQFVGWQIEAFLATAVRTSPHLIALLDHAELIGLTPDQLRRERQRVLGASGRLRAWLDHQIAKARHPRSPQRDEIVRSLITKTQLTFTPSRPLKA